MSETMHRVFVYGTLKRGFPNHRLLAEERFLGNVRTCEPYPLVVQGPWYTPAMIPEAGQGHQVVGELWEVSEAKLANLDELEGLGKPTGYLRELIHIAHADGTTERVWAYLKPRDRITVIHTDPLSDYQDERYIPAWRRSG
jgi:gamma-glutamylaminecyclotransferase